MCEKYDDAMLAPSAPLAEAPSAPLAEAFGRSRSPDPPSHVRRTGRTIVTVEMQDTRPPNGAFRGREQRKTARPPNQHRQGNASDSIVRGGSSPSQKYTIIGASPAYLLAHFDKSPNTVRYRPKFTSFPWGGVEI